MSMRTQLRISICSYAIGSAVEWLERWGRSTARPTASAGGSRGQRMKPSPATSDVIAAPAWRVVLACGVDVALVAAVVIASLSFRGTRFAELGPAIAVAGIIAVALAVRDFAVRGLTPGWRLGGIRLAAIGGFPAVGWHRPPHSRRIAADLRRGADPVDVRTPVPVFAAAVASPTAVREPVQPGVPRREPAQEHLERTIFAPAFERGWTVLLDGAAAAFLDRPIVLGRNPAEQPGETAIAVADLAREVSKNHLRVTLSEAGEPIVQDLGSTNGTVLLHRDGRSALVAGGRSVVVDEFITVRIGGHAVQFKRNGEVVA